MWGWKIFLKFLKCRVQNKIILWNLFLGGVAKRGVANYIGGESWRWWANSFFALRVILRTLLYLIIWFTLSSLSS